MIFHRIAAVIFITAACLAFCVGAWAQVLPADLTAMDVPNDGGQAIRLDWTVDAEAGDQPYQVFRQALGGSWELIGETKASTGKYVDSFAPENNDKPAHILKDGVSYSYKLVLPGETPSETSVVSGVAKGNWFHTERATTFAATMIYVFLVVLFIRKARSGQKMYVRPIAGINAVEEAVGRATEMGKPVLYIPGIGEIQEVATLAALTILTPIAKKVAEYDTPILVPNRDPVVFSVAQEIVRDAYSAAGKPDSYQEDNIFFLSGRQFAYAAAVSGIMMRERPATNFFFGMFYAESLILAETGAATGAIQIAGTDQVAQLPFFIAACDYTLIGEELYAASAYLSGDPVLVGSLKALDWAKVVLLSTMLAGLVAGAFGLNWIIDIL